MEKMARMRRTLEYKLEALRQIGDEQSIAAVPVGLGLARHHRRQAQFDIGTKSGVKVRHITLEKPM